MFDPSERFAVFLKSLNFAISSLERLSQAQ